MRYGIPLFIFCLFVPVSASLQAQGDLPLPAPDPGRQPGLLGQPPMPYLRRHLAFRSATVAIGSPDSTDPTGPDLYPQDSPIYLIRLHHRIPRRDRTVLTTNPPPPGYGDSPPPPGWALPVILRGDPATDPSFWLGAEALVWWSKSQPLPVPLITTGPASQGLNAGGLGVPGTVSLNGPLNYGVEGGARLLAGGWFDVSHTWGLDGSIFILGQSECGIRSHPTESYREWEFRHQ